MLCERFDQVDHIGHAEWFREEVPFFRQVVFADISARHQISARYQIGADINNIRIRGLVNREIACAESATPVLPGCPNECL